MESFSPANLSPIDCIPRFGSGEKNAKASHSASGFSRTIKVTVLVVTAATPLILDFLSSQQRLLSGLQGSKDKRQLLGVGRKGSRNVGKGRRLVEKTIFKGSAPKAGEN